MGEQLQDEFGGSVASAGDVNEDGYADVVIGAAGYPGGGSEFPLGYGRAYLYLGGAGGLSTVASWTATGERQSALFGSSVASAGDVNGDGNADVIVGANQMTGGGQAYLYLGGASGLPAAASWTAGGETASSYFGCSVASAGDVNGDGYSDVVIGAYGNVSDTGKAYLYLGRASGLSLVRSWTAVGEVTLQRFGASVASAGDVNSDGYADVIVGAHRYSSWAGKAYLYLAGRTGRACIPTRRCPSRACTASAESRSSTSGPQPARLGDRVHHPPRPRADRSLEPGGVECRGYGPGTPGLQYLDQTGDAGNAWYYKVTAYNAACAAEGP